MGTLLNKHRFINKKSNRYVISSSNKDIYALKIPFENRFGQYVNYLTQNVTLEFMEKYYTQYKNN
jgi:hypothetical protein